MINKVFKECNRDQVYLMPPSLNEWLSEGHLAYFIIDVVERLDLSEIYGSYAGDGRGQPPYNPSMMVSLIHCIQLGKRQAPERP